MAVYNTSKFESALLKKGFIQDKTHHRIFWFKIKGKQGAIKTRTSHNEKQFDDGMLNLRKHQMRLESKIQFEEYIECTLTLEMYIQYLIDKDIIPDPDKKEKSSDKENNISKKKKR
jgi:hypothetical protein